MRSSVVKKLYLLFIFSMIVLLPIKFNADEWKTKSECDAAGGVTTKGPAYRYMWYDTICRDSKGNQTTLQTKDGNCYSRQYSIKLGATPRYTVYLESRRVPTYMSKISDALYCCEIKNVCKVVDGKYYGKNGGEVSYTTFVNECVGETPTQPTQPTKPSAECIESDEPVPKTCNVSETESNVACVGEIKETELCGLIAGNGSDEYKTFSNSYCDIYCRREVQIEFQEIVEVLAGRYFKHSLGSKDENINNLSGVITVKYECGGQIRYNTWKKDWKSANEELIKAWNEYSKWNTIVNLAPLEIIEGDYSCASCAEAVCSETHYESCSGGDGCSEGGQKSVTTYFHVPGGPFQQATLYDYISKSTPSTSANCNANCEFTEGTCTNPTGSQSYSSKHKYGYNCGCDSGYSCTLESGVDPRPFLAAAASRYQAALSKINKLKQQILDCNNENNFFEDSTIDRDVAACGGDGTTTGGYDENTIFNEGYEVNIADSQSGTGSTTKVCNETSNWNEFCGSCDGKFSEGACSNETLVYYVCTGTPGQGECQNVTFSAPKNGSIKATRSDVSTHYQSAKHYNQLFTGKITNSRGDDSYLEMEDNVWPVGINRKTGKYDICYEINLDDPKGRISGGEAICNYIVVNELNHYDCDDPYNYHECYDCPDGEECYPCPDGENCDIDESNNDTMGVYFRSVDLEDLFPNSKYSKYNQNNSNITSFRKIGFNWKDSNSSQAIKTIVDNIQSKGKDIWTDTSSAELTVTLTPSAIRQIKQYNKNNEDYINTNNNLGLLKCYSNSLECKSGFMNSILSTYVGDENILFGENYNKNRYVKPGGGE